MIKYKLKPFMLYQDQYNANIDEQICYIKNIKIKFVLIMQMKKICNITMHGPIGYISVSTGQDDKEGE